MLKFVAHLYYLHKPYSHNKHSQTQIFVCILLIFKLRFKWIIWKIWSIYQHLFFKYTRFFLFHNTYFLYYLIGNNIFKSTITFNIWKMHIFLKENQL